MYFLGGVHSEQCTRSMCVGVAVRTGREKYAKIVVTKNDNLTTHICMHTMRNNVECLENPLRCYYRLFGIRVIAPLLHRWDDGMPL